MPDRLRMLALGAGLAFIALGLWQLATDRGEPSPAGTAAPSGE